MIYVSIIILCIALVLAVIKSINRYRREMLAQPTKGALLEDAGWCAVLEKGQRVIDVQKWMSNKGRLILLKNKLIFKTKEEELFDLSLNQLDIQYLNDYIDIIDKDKLYRVSLFPGAPKYMLPLVKPLMYRRWHYVIKKNNGSGLYKYSLFGFGLIDVAPLIIGLIFFIVVLNVVF